MKNFTSFLLLPALLMCWQTSVGQITEQDCPGAIPVCQDVFNQANSYSGTGGLPDEINALNSCLGGGELNSVWYTMTIQADGNLNFSIIPNDPLDDYDWAVFNLTNASCADIYNDASLEVSCNFSGNTDNIGITGPNGQGGPQSEPEVPVTAGEIYYINVSNFSSTQSGYTLDLSASSAAIYDDVPPELDTVPEPVYCADDEIIFDFSENVLCNSVSTGDFQLNGPGGPYNVTGVSSTNCTNGSEFSKQFILSIDPAVSAGGTYELRLTGPVEDACSNEASYPASIEFEVEAIDLSVEITPDTCSLNVGSATINTPPGTGPYNYSWSPNVSTGNAATGLSSGTYEVTVSSNGSCPQEIEFTIENQPPPNAAFTATQTTLPVDNPTTTFINQSTGATEYIWAFDDDSASTEENPRHTFPGVGEYTVMLIANSGNGCSDTAFLEIIVSYPDAIFIPNAFTPGHGDGSGLNDSFGPEGEGVSGTDFIMDIYDRWGRRIFRSTDPQVQWAGRNQFTNKLVPQGVYVYRIRFKDLNGKDRDYLGHVNLLRK